MSDTLFIPKVQNLTDDQNYQFLRKQGLQYIENLAHDLWTDYNEHDPGITIMELLCYAITELGYRGDFEMQDLLADKDGKTDAKQAFFSAKNILTVNPLTVEDFRKILIDIVGVSNAFMFPTETVKWEQGEEGIDTQVIPVTEIPFYPDCKKDELVYAQNSEDPVDVRGLYDVIVDLDDSEIYGDLNTGNVLYAFTQGDLLGLNVEAVLPAWRNADLKTVNKIIGSITSSTATENAAKDGWDILIHYNDGGDKTFEYTVNKTLSSPIKNIDQKITAELEKLPVQKSILKFYKKKINYIDDILQQCWNKLHARRNLCEDFLHIDTVCYVAVAVCCDIDVANTADIEEVLGNVWFAIEQYLNPTVNFYLLSELVAKGIPTDEIFEGPVLDHGFIDTNELVNAQLRSEILVSDIVNLLMDIEGVIAIRNLILTSYDDTGKAIEKNQKWCLHIPPYCKPVLNEFKSKILFFKDRLPFKAKMSEAFNVLRLLEANNERPKLKGHTDDLPIPTGKHYQLDDYLTVQYDLPQTYGVSKYGLSNEVSAARKAQAMQLRAYLLFYDQVLANFFSQLYHAKDLLSIDDNVVRTYFTQYLTQIKDVDKIYRKVKPSGSPDIFSLKNVLGGPVVSPASQHDVNLNKLYSALVETEDVFDDRRNRFLDHLLARFAETFNNYVFLLYTADKEKIASRELIGQKILFLKDYPVISSERGKAYDQLLHSWNTDNVSGFEKRVSRFTGIHDFTQRSLFCYPDYEVKNSGTDADPKFEFAIFNKHHEVVFHSITTYTSETLAEDAVNQVYEYMFDKHNYKIAKNSSNVFEVQLFNADGKQIAVSDKTFPNNLAAAHYLKQQLIVLQPDCNAEGMHLIEHILLRPRFAAEPVAPETAEGDYKLMQVCLNKDCKFCGEEDPYSFRASLLLPFWVPRFRDMDLRKYFEDVTEAESPAHTMIKVCWVSYTSMKKFEDIFKEWLNALQKYARDLKKDNDAKKLALKEANNKMVDFLKDIHSEYPEARLHDCVDGTTNPVRLGRTILGSF
jgi:hypothetical protein